MSLRPLATHGPAVPHRGVLEDTTKNVFFSEMHCQEKSACKRLSSELLEFVTTNQKEKCGDEDSAMSAGTRSAKRSLLLASVPPSDPFTKLMDMCARQGQSAYRLPLHGAGPALVDVDGVRALHELLRGLLSADVSTELPDTAMGELDGICGAAATASGLREWMERLRVWEQEQAAIVGEGDDRSRIHMYASATSAALACRTVELHGVQLRRTKKLSFEFDGEEFNLQVGDVTSLSWMGALSGRYTFLGTPHSFIDLLPLARAFCTKTDAVNIVSSAMCAWREECNKLVDAHVPSEAQPVVHLALDQFAVCSGDDAMKQGGPQAPYILAHSSKPGETHTDHDVWNNAYKVGIRQLRAIDSLYDIPSRADQDLLFGDLDVHNLSELASRAWEGDESLSGKTTAGLTDFATTRLYFGRSFPLRLLYPSSLTMPAEFSTYTFIIWPCPRRIWRFWFATSLVFSAIDSLFCGYVSTNAKATMAHMIDDSGQRADVAQILHEVRHGDAFYHSETQPQPEEDDVSNEDDEEDQTNPSAFEQVRARSVISISLRQQMLAKRGEFRKEVRKLCVEALSSTRASSQRAIPVTIAKW